jgi:chemotaxis signal transduction protein
VYLLPFRIETVWLAIDATHVAQILGQREWLPVPSAPALWPGVLAWHGRAVAVFDLGQVLRHPALSPGQSRRRTLICSAQGNWLAIMVDEIREAQVVAETLCRPSQVSQHRYASHEYEADDLILPIVDPVAIVREAISSDPAPGKVK